MPDMERIENHKQDLMTRGFICRLISTDRKITYTNDLIIMSLHNSDTVIMLSQLYSLQKEPWPNASDVIINKVDNRFLTYTINLS